MALISSTRLQRPDADADDDDDDDEDDSAIRKSYKAYIPATCFPLILRS